MAQRVKNLPAMQETQQMGFDPWIQQILWRIHGFALWNVLGTKNENIALSFSIRLGYCF